MQTSGNSRVERIWSRVFSERDKSGFSLERAKLLTASWKETDGLPTPIRRAKAFEKIVKEIPIYIDNEQLLVGDFSAKPMWPEWYPEFSAGWVLKDVDSEAALKTFRAQEANSAELKEIAEYWKDKCLENAFFSYVSAEKREKWMDIGEENSYIDRWLAFLDRLGGYHCVNYEKAIKKGFLGILTEVEEEIRRTHIGNDEALRKVNFLKGCVIVLKAGIQYAKRYACLARDLAEKAEGERKSELNKIADICEWVPGNPARTFHEAIQTLWFVHALVYLETRAEGASPGRVDQYLYPYFKHDIDAGKLTEEEVIELIGCLRIKMNGLRQLSSKYFFEGTSGEAQFHNITLGGQTPDGEDATNELSYLILEAAFRLRTPHPTLSIRVHEKLPENFFLKAIKLAATGVGYPAFFNDKSYIPFLMELGANLEEARGYAVGGCVVPQIPGRVGPGQPIPFTMAKCLELALHDGVDPYVTSKQVGPATGRFEDFGSFNELVEAFKKQVKYFAVEATTIMNLQRCLREQLICPVFNDVFIDDCIKRGKSSLGKGARYEIHYHNARGMIDTADSLAAIKKCVFEEGSINRQELIEALDNNFEGYDRVRKLLLSAPKYGNDDDYVDQIAADLYHWWQGMVLQLDAGYGTKYLPCAYSVGGHVPAGRKTGALPSGRLAGKSLADGSVSPCQGVDVKGPTAVLNSCSKIDQSRLVATLLNMKFQPSILKTKDDQRKLLALIKTYFDEGGKHIQFNTVDRETLIDAQLHPEHHRNLIVRVSGYSAFFTELLPSMQDEIIARTEHSLV
jgi:pyruvate formate-lyase/glycerol dehydratase family glycyl radical enzyme